MDLVFDFEERCFFCFVGGFGCARFAALPSAAALRDSAIACSIFFVAAICAGDLPFLRFICALGAAFFGDALRLVAIGLRFHVGRV